MKQQWKKRTIKLKEGHGWTSKPGYNIFAANRGDVRFEVPKDWLIKPTESGSIRFHDGEPPDDNCTLEMSTAILKDELGIDTSKLPLDQMVLDISKNDKRKPFFWDQAHKIDRSHVHAAWTEVHFMDPNEKRAAHSRTCVAFWSNIQVLITFDYWESDAARMTPVWDTVMETLVLGDYIEDPRRRVVD